MIVVEKLGRRCRMTREKKKVNRWCTYVTNCSNHKINCFLILIAQEIYQSTLCPHFKSISFVWQKPCWILLYTSFLQLLQTYNHSHVINQLLSSNTDSSAWAEEKECPWFMRREQWTSTSVKIRRSQICLVFQKQQSRGLFIKVAGCRYLLSVCIMTQSEQTADDRRKWSENKSRLVERFKRKAAAK